MRSARTEEVRALRKRWHWEPCQHCQVLALGQFSHWDVLERSKCSQTGCARPVPCSHC